MRGLRLCCCISVLASHAGRGLSCDALAEVLLDASPDPLPEEGRGQDGEPGGRKCSECAGQ